MTQNTNPEKPEWFELVDGDAPSAQVTKVNKKLPAIAVLVTGALIATGAFFASASENHHDDDQVASIDFNSGAQGTVTNEETSDEVFTTPPKGPEAPGVAPIKPPDGQRDGGDHDEFDEDGEHEERERHEGRERHERGERGGSAPQIPAPSTSTAAQGA
jgi:hypothetical protein